MLSVNYAFEYSKLPVTYLERKFADWNYTWNNRATLLGCYLDYDYVIDSDDDLELPRRAFDYYVANEGLPADYIAGFLTSEADRQGKRRLITMGNHSPKLVAETITIGDNQYITPNNLHSCCFIADKARFGLAVSRGLSSVPIKKHFYTNAEYARTEIYDKLTKVVSVDGIRTGDALVNHLPNNNLTYGNAFIAGLGASYPQHERFTVSGNTVKSQPVAIVIPVSFAEKAKSAEKHKTAQPRTITAQSNLSSVTSVSFVTSTKKTCCGGSKPRGASNPNAVEVVINGGKAAVRVAKSISSNSPVLVSKEEETRRLATCHGCKHFTGTKCELCGCFTALKTKLATERCPANKW